MSYSTWLNNIKNAEKTSVIKANLRKIHYKFSNGNEMAEEYSMDTGIVLRRAWKMASTLRGESEWTIELGDIVRPLNNNDNFLVKESLTEVILFCSHLM